MPSNNQMTFHDPSFLSSWPSMLYNVLKRPSYSFAPQASNRTRSRHCSGNIWKHFISASIYYDLASISTTNIIRMTRTIRRRFVRLEHIGLSGVILYEIRMCPPCCFSERDSAGVGDYLTMQRVFGDPEVATDNSMDLDDLLDAVHAKVVHFPTYACTSFIAGQVMNAYLSNRPELTPIPAPSGFSVLASESPTRICTSFIPSIGQCSDDASICGAPFKLSPSGFYLDGLQEAFSLVDDDPYLALCVRTSSLDSSFHSSTSKISEAGDVGDSTIDSLGPYTPPRLSHRLISSGKRNVVSEAPPGFISPSPLHFTEENELTSFIDFSESFVEDVDAAIY